MNVVIVPARYGSKRFPGKVLKDLNGYPVIVWVLRNVSASKLADRIIVATDSMEIAKVVENYGFEAVMTSPEHPSGTDRIAEVVSLNEDFKYIVNVQADEPFMHHSIVDQMFLELQGAPQSIITPITDAKPEEVEDPNVVKVVLDRFGYALYFSRQAIPYGGRVYYKHIGAYAYTRETLLRFVGLHRSYLEISENLEQLRALENGIPIKCIHVHYDGISIDTPEDLERAREYARGTDIQRKDI